MTTSALNTKDRRTLAQFHKKLEACKTRIGKERDKLRGLLSEYEEILGHCDEAYDDLERTADTLSQLL